MRKIFSLLLVAAGMFCGIQNMQAVEAPANAKAYGYVQVGKGANPVWGDAAVLSDYSAYLRLPDQTAKIKLTDTIYADVFAAGRHKSFHYNTGIVLPKGENIAPTLPQWNQCQYAPQLLGQSVEECRQELIDYINDSIQKRVTVSLGSAAVEGGLTVQNFYTFDHAAFNVKVMTEGGSANGGQEQTFTYNLAGSNEQIEGNWYRVLSADPSSQSAINAAINIVKTQFAKSTSSVSELCIKSGSYIQYGEERMFFFNDVVLGKNDMTMEKILRAISENSSIRNPGITNDTCKAVAFLIADSYVSARGRKVILNQDVTVTVDASTTVNDAPIMKNVLSTLWKYADENKRTEFFRTLVALANNLALKIDQSTIPVEVNFAYTPWDTIRGSVDAGVVFDDHELAPGEIGTFCSPYAYTQTRGGIVYSLVKRNADVCQDVTEIELVEATYPLVAGQPYVFFATAPVLEGMMDENVIPAISAGSFHGLIGYMGYEATLTLPYTPYQNCVIYQNHLRRAGNGSSIKSGMAYINLSQVPTSEPSPVPGRRMRVGNGTNATTDLESNGEAAVATKVLKDGELMIIKNGVRYNAQGQIVK